MNTPLHFKQQLADELNARATVLAAPTALRPRIRAPRRRLTFTLGAVAAAAAVAIAVPLAGGSHDTQAGSVSIDVATANYTVKSIPDGTIAVKLMNSKGIPGLQAALSQAGIPAAVMGFSTSCHAKVDHDNSVDIEKVFPHSADGHGELIRLSAVPKGEHLLITPTIAPNGAIGGLEMSVVREVPNCVPASDNGIGAGYVAPGTNP